MSDSFKHIKSALRTLSSVLMRDPGFLEVLNDVNNDKVRKYRVKELVAVSKDIIAGIHHKWKSKFDTDEELKIDFSKINAFIHSIESKL